MTNHDDNLRDGLLAQLPQPDDLPRYRREVEAMLAQNRQWFARERRVVQAGWVLCIVIAVGFLWFDGSASTVAKGPWLACFTFLLGMMAMLKLFINQCRIDVLKEVKQVELQVMELRDQVRRQTS